jgi:hypothetical protein
MNKLLLVVLLALTGCATKLPQPNVTLPAELTQKCPQQLDKLEGMSGADMLKNIVANAQTYYACADMHNKLVDAVEPRKK